MGIQTSFTTQDRSLAGISAAFNVNAYEYHNRTGRGLLISVGSGLMLATMDMLPSAKVCVDFTKSERENIYFPDWLSLAANWADYVAVHGWLTITKPEALMEALRVVPSNKLFYRVNADLGRGTRFKTMQELCDHLNELPNNAPIKGLYPVESDQSR